MSILEKTPGPHTNGIKVNGAGLGDDPRASNLLERVQEYGSGRTYDREKLRDAAYRLALSLETPGETVQRIAYLPLHLSVARVANRLNIFHAIVESPCPISSTELAVTVGADPVLLIRLLRYLVAAGMVGEADVDRYEPTNVTRNLAIPALAAGINHTYNTVGRVATVLDDFLAKTAYQNPVNVKDCAFQMAFDTQDDMFEWFPKHPEKLYDFNIWMTGQREGRANWLDFFPLEETLSTGFKGGDDAVMFVDIGGSKGHETAAIMERYPHLPGRYILQDLPNTIKQAVSVPGLECMAHDFFQDQPIQGAKCYYLRNVLHDWPDAECHTILTKTIAAMTPGYSTLLINEMVVPDKGASLVAAQRDIVMMSLLAAMERTEQMWMQMLSKAGLTVRRIWQKTPDAESVIVAVKE